MWLSMAEHAVSLSVNINHGGGGLAEGALSFQAGGADPLHVFGAPRLMTKPQLHYGVGSEGKAKDRKSQKPRIRS
jgi:hypothetical protein